jgi:hypothetical protein
MGRSPQSCGCQHGRVQRLIVNGRYHARGPRSGATCVCTVYVVPRSLICTEQGRIMRGLGARGHALPRNFGRAPSTCPSGESSLVLNFRDLALPSPRGVAANATPRRFPLRLITRKLVLRHMTLILRQLFQISFERGLCFNHCIERLLDLGRQIICIDVLPL